MDLPDNVALTESVASPAKKIFLNFFFYAWFAVLIAFAIHIRIQGISAYHLNCDELEVLFIARGNTLMEVLRFALSDPHPPFFHVLLHYWMQISDTSFFLRSLSLLFGIASVPLFYLITEYIGGRFAGMLCAAFLTFSDGMVSVSFQVRDYTCFLFFLGLAFYAMQRWRDTHSNKMLVVYLIAGTLACVTHFTGIMGMFCLCSVEAAYCLRIKPISRKQLVKWLVANALVASVALAVYIQWQPVRALLIPPALPSHLVGPAIMTPVHILQFLFPTSYILLVFPVLYCCVYFGLRRNSPSRIPPFYWLLMAAAAVMGICLYLLRIVPPGYAGIGRHNLWLTPFMLPVLASWVAENLTAGAAPEKRAVVIRMLCWTMLFMVAGMALYNPTLRVRLGEPMVTEETFTQLQDYLKTLDGHALIVADRNTGFALIPKEYNPYRYFEYWNWRGNQQNKIVPLYNTHMLFNSSSMRFFNKWLVLRSYNDALAKGLMGDEDKLVFIRNGGGWNADGVDEVFRCKALDREVKTFPVGGATYTDQAITVSRRDFENMLLPHGQTPPICP